MRIPDGTSSSGGVTGPAATPAPDAVGPQSLPDGPPPDGPKEIPGAPNQAAGEVDTAVSKARLQMLAKADPPAEAKKAGFDPIEANKQVIGVRDTAESVQKLGQLSVGQLSQHIDGLTNRIGELGAKSAAIEQDIQSLMSQMSKANVAEFNQLSGELQQLTKQGEAVRGQMNALEGEMGLVQKALKLTGKGEQLAGKVAGMLEGTKKLASHAGKLSIGLDTIANFNEFEKANPGNPGQNLTKACVATATKLAMDLKTAKMAVNPRETAVGALKFVMETAGLKDTAAYQSVDAISQGFPIDVASKVAANMVDLGFATYNYAQGDAKSMMDLADRNLNGKSGLVIQGVSVLGDLVMTGGKNIPVNDDALTLASVFQNPGRTDVPAIAGRTAKEKIALLDQLTDQKPAPDDVLKIRNVLSNSTPAQLEAVLERVSPETLAKNLPNNGLSGDQAAGAFIDMSLSAAVSNRGDAQAPVWKQLDRFLVAAQNNGHPEVVDTLRSQLEAGGLKHLPGWLQQRIRNGI
ncbi:MAG: hypothetical protein SFV54_22100 [Bryobacteraceae bacterium]|nr:hypothetical protein [Bryobacteraceae bacterium]